MQPNPVVAVHLEVEGGHSGTCKERAVREPWLESEVARLLKRLTIPGAVLAFLRKRVPSGVEEEKRRRAAVRNSLKSSIASTQREEENLLSLRLRDVLDDARFLARQKDLRDRRAGLEQRLAHVDEGTVAPGETILRTLEFKIPFRLVAESGGIGNFSSLVSDVRKWLDEKTEHFTIPDLNAEPEYGTLPPLKYEVA